MQNNNSNKIRKQHYRILGLAEGFVPIPLYMKILLPHTHTQKPAEAAQPLGSPRDWWGNGSSNSIGARPKPKPTRQHPVRGQFGAGVGVLHAFFAPTLCLVCAGAETHTSLHLWSCKTENNIKKHAFLFVLKFSPMRFCNLFFKLIYSFRKIHIGKTGELSVA